MNEPTTHEPPKISYATVRDFVHSLENHPFLASQSGDLKDVQRPWAYKTAMQMASSGARLLEFGAGAPLVASALAKAGYDVTVVDPYDGSGNGPRDFEDYVAQFPEVNFVRSILRDGLVDLQPNSFDLIYSVSVVEHIRPLGVDDLIAGIHRYLKPEGRHFHAIDFVLSGQAAAYHRSMLYKFLEHCKIGRSDIDAVILKANSDTETYFLSAESHNRWRGQTPYDEFPMRKVISVQCIS